MEYLVGTNLLITLLVMLVGVILAFLVGSLIGISIANAIERRQYKKAQEAKKSWFYTSNN